MLMVVDEGFSHDRLTLVSKHQDLREYHIMDKNMSLHAIWFTKFKFFILILLTLVSRMIT